MKKETIEIMIDEDGTVGADHKSGTDASCVDALNELLDGLGDVSPVQLKPQARRRAKAGTAIRGKA